MIISHYIPADALQFQVSFYSDEALQVNTTPLMKTSVTQLQSEFEKLPQEQKTDEADPAPGPPCSPLGRIVRCSSDKDPHAFLITRDYCGYVRSTDHIAALEASLAETKASPREATSCLPLQRPWQAAVLLAWPIGDLEPARCTVSRGRFRLKGYEALSSRLVHSLA